ncbi:MAG TPA: hypothetical protein VII05_05150 [Gaiellaceae bacterium]|jgi:hypothetical protein
MSRVLIGSALLVIGLGSGLAVGLTHREIQTRTLRSTTTEVVNGSRRAGPIPAPIPTLLDGPTDDPHELALSAAVPVDASLDSAKYVEQKPRQLIVTWHREHLTQYTTTSWRRVGIAIWQPGHGDDAYWHRVYAYETPTYNQYLVGFGVSLGDISGDGRPEILVFFYSDGSSGGGTYHLFVNTGYRLRQPLVEPLDLDAGAMLFSHGALVRFEGVDFRGPGTHCCYRNVRETRLRWDGHRLITVRETVRKNRRGWREGSVPSTSFP